jgi:hypothetical protein
MTDRHEAPRDPEQLKKILVMREHARADAWLRKDRRALEALLAPDFVETNSMGRFSRKELLDRLFPVLTLHEFAMESPSLRITGTNTAVLSYRCRERLTAEGKLVGGAFRVFATYTCDGKQYQLSAWDIRPVS